VKKQFLPTTIGELKERKIEQLDFVYVTGDAYVDHPSFGHAIISRVLESHGYTVGILPQPDWRDPENVKVLGRPRLGFLVSAGNMDSMVNHYSVSKKRRQKDAYTPGGEMGKRPDYAAVVYSNLIRQAYRDVPIIVGGIEASLRRLAHYDYWSDSLKRSVLMDSGANLISYGMGERSIVEIADALNAGMAVSDITFVDGTCYRTKQLENVYDYILLPQYQEMLEDKRRYAESFYTQYCNTDPFAGKRLVEPYGTVYVVQNPPAKPLSTQEMDDVYDLPYCGTYHPMYEAAGGIPAIEEVKFSLVSNRGCFGGCNFCALTFHQGRIIQVRSHDSILREAQAMTEDPDFKGYIHDVGGPTANFRQPSCEKQLTKGVCKNRQCLFPSPCKNLKIDHSDYVELLRKLRKVPKVKKVFIRSGIRFDYLIADRSDAFFRDLVKYHISGQLKVAPEHVSNKVLQMMGKPEHSVYEKFAKKYQQMNQSCGMNQFLVPYLMSSHPGCSMTEAVELACYLRGLGYMPEQVQDFYPTPSTISTCMYYTGLDPRTMEPVYVEKNPHYKALQRALIQYRRPENRDLVEEALHIAGREDLIGFSKDCLIRPRSADARGRNAGQGGNFGAGNMNPGRRSGNENPRSGRVNRQSAHANGKAGGRIETSGRQSGDTKGRNASSGRPSGSSRKHRTIRNVHKKK
jgi:uncharacterized radical SAM protein YgiQ